MKREKGKDNMDVNDTWVMNGKYRNELRNMLCYLSV
jgi:hypothetical protein